MDPQQQRLELEATLAGDDDLAIEDATVRQGGAEPGSELGEIAIERLEVARLDVRLVTVAEDDRPEAVPLRLEQPAIALGQRIGCLREHRLDRRFEREL